MEMLKKELEELGLVFRDSGDWWFSNNDGKKLGRNEKIDLETELSRSLLSRNS